MHAAGKMDRALAVDRVPARRIGSAEKPGVKAHAYNRFFYGQTGAGFGRDGKDIF